VREKMQADEAMNKAKKDLGERNTQYEELKRQNGKLTEDLRGA
jgi:hypothetical protein